MIAIQQPVAAQTVEALEDFLYDEDATYSPWSLHCDVDNGQQWALHGYFESETQAIAAWEALCAQFTNLPVQTKLTAIEPAQWQNAYKAYLQPWSHGPLHWVPVWMKEEYTLPESAVALLMDAGMAFGTGSHETTRLCAMRLIEYTQAHKENLASIRFIDAGCGSGILALSAYKLGLREAYAFDIDPEAIVVSRENQAFNNIPEGAIRWAVADLEGGLKGRKADLILANIQTEVLIPNAQVLLSALDAGAALVLSGILAREVEAVAQVYQQTATQLGLTLASIDRRQLGDWSDLMLILK